MLSTTLRRWGIITSVTGTAVAGLVLATTTAAGAATAPHITVKPSTGLASTAKVKVSATGFKAHETIAVGECAVKKLACAVPYVTVVANSAGSASTSYTVTSKFTFQVQGHPVTINCNKVSGGCEVTAIGEQGNTANAKISFKA
jgi:hypothetical protein